MAPTWHGLPDLDGISVAGQLAGLDAPPEVVLISSREAATSFRRHESGTL